MMTTGGCCTSAKSDKSYPLGFKRTGHSALAGFQSFSRPPLHFMNLELNPRRKQRFAQLLKRPFRRPNSPLRTPVAWSKVFMFLALQFSSRMDTTQAPSPSTTQIISTSPSIHFSRRTGFLPVARTIFSPFRRPNLLPALARTFSLPAEQPLSSPVVRALFSRRCPNHYSARRLSPYRRSQRSSKHARWVRAAAPVSFPLDTG
jgi:hypothetical protein